MSKNIRISYTSGILIQKGIGLQKSCTSEFAKLTSSPESVNLMMIVMTIDDNNDGGDGEDDDQTIQVKIKGTSTRCLFYWPY